MDITLERAAELIQEKRLKEEQSHLKQFDEDPDLEVRLWPLGALHRL